MGDKSPRDVFWWKEERLVPDDRMGKRVLIVRRQIGMAEGFRSNECQAVIGDNK